ncbi:MAG: four helix bundle protein [Patescibacteria group bacterium]|jgi:four helix bundle protein
MAIQSFKDLYVYQNAYSSAVVVMKDVVVKLPASERYGLVDQLGRSAKAIAPLIAEGFAKKHMPKSFKKYLDDAMGECNETIVHISYCMDIYGGNIDKKICERLLKNYDLINKQLYKLSLAWKNFNRKDLRP